MQHRDRDNRVRDAQGSGAEPVTFRPQHESNLVGRICRELVEGHSIRRERECGDVEACCTQLVGTLWRVREQGPRHLQHGAHTHSHAASVERIGAPWGDQHRVGSQPSDGTEDRADVGVVDDVFEDYDAPGIPEHLGDRPEGWAVHGREGSTMQVEAGQGLQERGRSHEHRDVVPGQKWLKLGKPLLEHEQRSRPVTCRKSTRDNLRGLGNVQAALGLSASTEGHIGQIGVVAEPRVGEVVDLDELHKRAVCQQSETFWKTPLFSLETHQKAGGRMSAPSSAAAPVTSAALEAAVAVLRGRTIAVLTGAGVSTDSGIPDYRGEGAPVRTPMTFQQFIADAEYRKRYWAGSHLGWKRFDSAEPNAGHTALADLELAGLVDGVITQNVDGLHLRAGSQRVVDLHGTMDRVRCLHCGQYFARGGIADRITADNPWLDTPDAVELSPDGDVEIRDVEQFVTPACSVCGGVLKPDVVFFGEFVPKEKFSEAAALVDSADALIVAGSSLAVNSGIRLLEKATRRKLPIVIINRGTTKGDSRATVKIEEGTSETLVALLEKLGD